MWQIYKKKFWGGECINGTFLCIFSREILLSLTGPLQVRYPCHPFNEPKTKKSRDCPLFSSKKISLENGHVNGFSPSPPSLLPLPPFLSFSLSLSLSLSFSSWK